MWCGRAVGGWVEAALEGVELGGSVVEGVAEGAGVGAMGGVALEGGGEGVDEGGWGAGEEVGEGVGFGMGIEEGALAGEEAPEEEGEGEEVAAVGVGLAGADLGGGPVEAAESLCPVGHAAFGRGEVAGLGDGVVARGELGHAEVDEGGVEVGAAVDEDVGGVEVAVEDPAIVEGGEGVGELAAGSDDLGELEGTAGEAEVGGGAAWGEGEDEVGAVGVGEVGFVEAREGGVLDGAEGPGFEAEATAAVGRGVGAEALEGDVAGGVAVVGAVDVGGRAAAEEVEDFVAAIEEGGVGVGRVVVLERGEAVVESEGGRDPVVGIEGEGGGDEGVEVGGDVEVGAEGPHGPVGARDGEVSGAELVEGDAEGVEVEAGIGGDEAGFRGDVAGGADDATAVGGARRRFGARDEGGREEVGDAVVGGVCRRGLVGGRDDGGREERGDAEVDELDAGATGGALEGDDVAGLDVAVDDAGAMEGDEGVGDLEGDLEGVAPGEGAAAEVLVEAGAREVLEGDEGGAVVGLAEGEDLDEARVADVGEEAGLGEEAALGEGLAGLEELEGDRGAEDEVVAEVDPGHASAADPFADAEAAGEELAAEVVAALGVRGPGEGWGGGVAGRGRGDMGGLVRGARVVAHRDHKEEVWRKGKGIFAWGDRRAWALAQKTGPGAGDPLDRDQENRPRSIDRHRVQNGWEANAAAPI